VNQTASIGLLIVVALLAANLPFLSERFLGVLPLRRPKSIGLRALELLLLYLAVGGLGLMLEARLGRVSPQGWEFYAVSGALFLTLAFPGFVWRHLRRR